jgi:hypothetical protein
MNPIFSSKFDIFCSAGENQCGIHCPPKYMANLFSANSSSKLVARGVRTGLNTKKN